MFDSLHEEEKICDMIAAGEELPGITDHQQAVMDGFYGAIKEVKAEYDDRDPHGEDVDTLCQQIRHEIAQEALRDVYERIVLAAQQFYNYCVTEENSYNEEYEAGSRRD